MLELLLDDSKTYQNAPKNIFLNKLEKAFNQFMKSKDTSLSVMRGKCCSKGCPNTGAKGFSFVGNVSGKHLDLIFEDTETDYADIYQCHGFETQSEIENLAGNFILDIKDDEKSDFIPDVDFLIKSQKCRMACEELADAASREMLGPDIYLGWLDKHGELFRSFDESFINFRDFDNFYNLFFSVKRLASYLDNEEEAEKAYQEYILLTPGDEDKLLIWLTTYERLGEQLVIFSFPTSPVSKESDMAYYSFDEIRISAFEFSNIIRFKKIFDGIYWEMVKKYSTFNYVEPKRFNEKNEEIHSYDSLTFHLKRRGILK